MHPLIESWHAILFRAATPRGARQFYATCELIEPPPRPWARAGVVSDRKGIVSILKGTSPVHPGPVDLRVRLRGRGGAPRAKWTHWVLPPQIDPRRAEAAGAALKTLNVLLVGWDAAT